MTSMCSLRSSIVIPELARDLRHLMVLQQAQVIGDDLFGRRALEPEMAQLQQQALLQIARRDAGRIEALHQLQRALHVGHRPRAHRRQLVERRHQIPVVVEVADDGGADVPQRRVVGLHRQLPHQVVRQRARRRQRVLDRRQLLDFLRRPRAVAVVQVVAEEILVVLIVPGVGLVGCCSGSDFSCVGAASAGCRSSVGTSSSIGFSTIS